MLRLIFEHQFLVPTINSWNVIMTQKIELPITTQICNLGTLEKQFVNSHNFQRLKSLREVNCKKIEDIPTRNEFSVFFQG